jgi:hypothetical protein
MKTNRIKGKLICAEKIGKTSFNKYQSVARPVFGQCSDNLELCPGAQSHGNQICVF